MNLKNLLLMTTVLILASCGTISTKNQHMTNTPFPDKAPKLITVRDFEIGSAQLLRDAADSDLPEQAVEQIGGNLTTDLREAGYRSNLLTTKQTAGPQGWVVTGRLRVMQWSNIADNASDKSAKDDRIECTVYVYDVSKSRVQPFMTFDLNTSRKSAALPEDQEDPSFRGAGTSDADLSGVCGVISMRIVDQIQAYIRQNF